MADRSPSPPDQISSSSEDGAGGPSGDPLSLVQDQEQEVLRQREHIRLNGDVDEPSSSEWWQQHEDAFQNSHMDYSSSGLPRKVPFCVLEEITDGFSDERKLGTGAFGKVFLGLHNNGEKIAVKVLYDMAGFEEKQFLNEFNNLARLHHPNIVQLVGYCYEIQKECVEYKGRFIVADRIRRVLCLEYMHNGSLDKYLFDEDHEPGWNTCYTLIKGICKGLGYLHEELKPPIYHLDLKPANVLLDENMLPKIADFGLSRFFGEEGTQITQSFLGTRGYLPPEYIDKNIISSKFDIFSLGVVIIKMMTGHSGYIKCWDMSPQKFVELTHETWRTRLQETPKHLFESYSKQVKKCMEIALSCVEADRYKRPSIGDIVKQLNETETMICKYSLPPRLRHYNGSWTDQGMSTTKMTRFVGKYELGSTIGEGTFAKVKFARDTESGQPVAIKILDKEKVLKHKMVEQIKREISTVKLIKHPNVIHIHEVMASKSKIYIVLEYATDGALFETIVRHGRIKEGVARRYFQQLIDAVDYCHSRGVFHRNLKPEKILLDPYGNLKISGFGLSALSQQIKEDGLLHTTCGTPNYVAPEVLEGLGYDGATADLWSCGVILFVLLAGYLPFEHENLMMLCKKISNAECTFPPWTSFPAKRLLTRILDPNPMTRITISEILEDEWFKKDYKHMEFDDNYDTTWDDVDAVFNFLEEHHVTEKKEPVALNAFELISMSNSFNLGNLFNSEQEFEGETRFISTCPPKEIVHRIEEAAKLLGFDVQTENYKLMLKNKKAGRKGNLNVVAEIRQIAPSLHMVEIRKAKGDTLEFYKFYENLSKTLKDIVSNPADL